MTLYIEKRKSGLVRITKMVKGVRYRVSVHFEPTKEEAEVLIENEIKKHRHGNPISKRKLVDIQKWNKEKVFVYFVKCELTGFTKIGVTSDMKRRLDALYTACGSPLTVINTLEFGSYREAFDAEKHFHQFYDAVRLNPGRKTEWFDIALPEVKIPIAITNYNMKKEAS